MQKLCKRDIAAEQAPEPLRGQELLAAETRLVEGEVPSELDGALVTTPTYALSHDAFMLSLPNGLRFHYQRGAGCTYARRADTLDADIPLFFNGSVYGAIAWLNGLIPLHASSIIHRGRVFAFTGVSGEGKSTLAAALAGEGFTLFSDDVLVLDVSAPVGVVAFPGHKQLKLWGDALKLTNQTAGDAVRDGIDKFYARDVSFAGRDPAPLGVLYDLKSVATDAANIERVNGMARFNMLRAAYYRPHFCAAIAESKNFFAYTSRIAGAIDMFTFDRPRDKSKFRDNVAQLAAHIRARG